MDYKVFLKFCLFYIRDTVASEEILRCWLFLYLVSFDIKEAGYLNFKRVGGDCKTKYPVLFF